MDDMRNKIIRLSGGDIELQAEVLAAFEEMQLEIESLERHNGDLYADSMKWHGDSEVLEKIVGPVRKLKAEGENLKTLPWLYYGVSREVFQVICDYIELEGGLNND